MSLNNVLYRSCMMIVLVCVTMLSAFVPAWGQSGNKISGVVTDENGEPLIGVAVMIQGKDKEGTITDLDGKFFLGNIPGDTKLCFSCIGFEVLILDASNNMTVILKQSSTYLDEVVVVGYGVQKKVNVTGSVTQVGSEVLESRPVSNVMQALQGVMPGLNISVNSSQGGELGARANINIRGAGTIGAGSSSAPLVLIDGVEGNINMINPSDIENISVLKDASASSIYGSRAPFGVILVTTKSAKAGKVTVSYTDNFRFNSAMSLPEKLTTMEYITLLNDGAINAGQTPVFKQSDLENVMKREEGKIGYYIPINAGLLTWTNPRANGETDWYDVYYKDWVLSQDHSVSVRGGSDKMSFFLSGNYMDQEGLLRFGSDNLKRYSVNAKIHSQIRSWLILDYNMRWNRVDYNAPTYAVNSGGLFYHNVIRKRPLELPIDPNGYYTDSSDIPRLLDGGRHKEIDDQQMHQLKLVVEPLKGWNITAQGGMRISNTDTHSEVLPIYVHNIEGELYAVRMDEKNPPGTSRLSEKSANSRFFTTNIFTDYSFERSGHTAKFLLGFNSELFKFENLMGERSDLITPQLPTLNTATSNDKTAGGKSHWATAGFFFRTNYDYQGCYLLEFNMRYDGSSRFRKDKRWNLFTSVSGGWNIAREPFMKNVTHVVNTLKLRGSYGELGNQNTNSLYPFYEMMNLSMNNGSWLVNGQMTNVANPPAMISSLLTWERVRTTNVALDFGFLDNRLTGSVEWFTRGTFGMVGPAPQLPSNLGTAVPKVNNADMVSRGWDLELGWRDQIKDFRYGVKVIFSDARQKILRYPNETGSLSTWYAGKYMGDQWGYVTEGMARTDEEMNEHLATLPEGGQNILGNNWQAGDIMYKDVNGDQKISRGANTLKEHGDLQVIANTSPRYRYGITFEAGWKGLDFSMFLQGVGKRDFIPQTGADGAIFWGVVNNKFQCTGLKGHFDYFRPEGHPAGANLDAYYPRPDMGSEKNHFAQTRYVQDASYLRLKNIQLGYTLPRELLDKAGISRVRFYVSGENLFTITKLTKLFDPELLGGVWGGGKTYPLSKVLSFGVNFDF